MLLPQSAHQREAPLVPFLKTRHRGVLPGLIAPRRALAIVSVSLMAAVVAFPFLGEEFLPHFKEYDFLMHWVEKPGTSLDAMRRITLRASDELRAIPGVRTLGAHIGRGEVADEVVGINFTELWISLELSVDYAATVATVQAVVDGYPGLQRDLLTYLRERIKEVLTGAGATIVVRVFGPELEVLQRKAAEVGKAMAGVEGAADVTVQALTLRAPRGRRVRP
jgi:Cu/Ag efflux pump CusA